MKEFPSVNTCSTAKGIAKMGAYMANKGTFQGRSIMSKETVE